MKPKPSFALVLLAAFPLLVSCGDKEEREEKKMDLTLLWAPALGVATLFVAWWRASRVNKADPGPANMQEIAAAIREGAMAFLSREYRVLAIFVVVVAALLAVANLGGEDAGSFRHPLIALSFFVGAVCSGLAGYFGMRVATAANDKLFEICRNYPDRFAGFAALPTADPIASANELERCVDKLNFKGAMIHGLTGGDTFFDDKRFWPIYERAQALGVPLYIHPGNPHPAVVDAYLKDYVDKFPGVRNAGWGFTMETATAGIRIVLSGVLEEYPDTKIILGHLGETLPFLMWRIDLALNRPGNDGVAFRDLFSSHFYITTSGFFSDPAVLCCIQEMGIDRILFAIDYPFVPNEPGPQWMERLMLNAEDKAKILHGNAEKLLKM